MNVGRIGPGRRREGGNGMMEKSEKLLSGLFNSQGVYAWSATKKNGESVNLLLLFGIVEG